MHGAVTMRYLPRLGFVTTLLANLVVIRMETTVIAKLCAAKTPRFVVFPFMIANTLVLLRAVGLILPAVRPDTK